MQSGTAGARRRAPGRRLAIVLGALASCAALIGQAFATVLEEEEPCMAPAAVTEEMVREARMHDLESFGAVGSAPAFVTGWLSPTSSEIAGSVIFVRAADGAWRAFLPRPGEGLVGIYRAASGALIIVTMWQTEGPGQAWTLLRSRDGLASGACVNVDFPDALNKPLWMNEFLHLVDLDIDARGRGEIIGVARTENRGELWYAYRTRDGGATWSKPRRLRRQRAIRNGEYAKIEGTPAPAELAAELERFAAGR
jgi:hypothetical protein